MTGKVETGPQTGGDRRRWALIVLACALVMDILDLTIVNVAVPTLQSHFGAGETEAQWLVAGYATLFAILLIVGGRLGDILGYKRMFVTGMSGFVLASMACGFAPTPVWLIAGRLFQAVAAAMMLPQIMSIVQHLYTPRERISALGVFSVLGGTAAISGPVVGGLLIGANLWGLGWRTIFLVNVPIGLATVIAASRLLPDIRSTHALRIDVPGMILSMFVLGALMIPLVEGRALGWPLWCVALLAAAPMLAAKLWIYSKRRMARDGSAAIVPDLFHSRSFTLGIILTVAFQIAMAGLLFTLTLAFQQGLGFSAELAGIVHIPHALGAAVGIGFAARKVLPKVGPKLITWGSIVMTSGLVAVVLLMQAMPLPIFCFFPAMFALGLGMGMVAAPLSQIALSEVDVGHAGSASGMLKSLQESGGAVGVAVLGGLFFTLRDQGSAQGSSLHAFAVVASMIAAILLAVGLMALLVPRSLPIFERG